MRNKACNEPPFSKVGARRAEGCRGLIQKQSSVPTYQPSVTANKLSATASSPEAAPPLSALRTFPQRGYLRKGRLKLNIDPLDLIDKICASPRRSPLCLAGATLAGHSTPRSATSPLPKKQGLFGDPLPTSAY